MNPSNLLWCAWDRLRWFLSKAERTRVAAVKAAGDLRPDNSSNHHFIPRSLLKKFRVGGQIPVRVVATGKTPRRTEGQIARQHGLYRTHKATKDERSFETSFNRLCDKPFAKHLHAVTSARSSPDERIAAALWLVPGAACLAVRVQHYFVAQNSAPQSEDERLEDLGAARVWADWAMEEWGEAARRGWLRMTIATVPASTRTVMLSDGGPLLDEIDSNGSRSATGDPRLWPDRDWQGQRKVKSEEPARRLEMSLAVSPSRVLTWEVDQTADSEIRTATMAAKDVDDFNKRTIDRALEILLGPTAHETPWPY